MLKRWKTLGIEKYRFRKFDVLPKSVSVADFNILSFHIKEIIVNLRSFCNL